MAGARHPRGQPLLRVCRGRRLRAVLVKFCSYFPYNGKLCINGNDYAKRQAAKAAIGFEALDNGFKSCADPARLQCICDRLSAAKIDALVRKWLRILPHPFTPADRRIYRATTSARPPRPRSPLRQTLHRRCSR